MINNPNNKILYIVQKGNLFDVSKIEFLKSQLLYDSIFNDILTNFEIIVELKENNSELTDIEIAIIMNIYNRDNNYNEFMVGRILVNKEW